MFGSTPGFSTATTASGASIFNFAGTPSTTSATPSLFGGTTPAAPATTSLFGTPSATTPATTSLFGTPSATTTTPSLFGTPSTTTAPATTSLFGTPSATTSPSLFGTPSSTSTSLFGGTPTPGFGPTLWPAAGAAGGAAGAAGAQMNLKPTNLTPVQAIQAISAAWGKDSAHCKFTHFFYNLVNPSSVRKLAQPPNVHEKLWVQALKDNPDPTRLAPLQIRGFAELRHRVEQQDKAAQEQQKALKEIQNIITGLQQKHELTTAFKIEEYKSRHMQLAARVLKIMRRIEVMRSLGYPISLEEEAFRKKLENLYMELNKPTQFKGRLNELTSLVRMQDEATQTNYEPLDPESMQQIFKYLHQQQEGLKHLTDIVKSDMKDLQTITSFFEEDGNRAK